MLRTRRCSYLRLPSVSSIYAPMSLVCLVKVLKVISKEVRWGAQKFSNEHHIQQLGFAINQLSQISSYHDIKLLFG